MSAPRAPAPALAWLNPLARAREEWLVAAAPAEVLRAVEALPEQFWTLAGRACLQRNTWYRNPWKTWAVVRCERAEAGTRVRVTYASNPLTTLFVVIGIAVCYATMPVADATLYVTTLGGVLALVGSFARFVSREDVAVLHARLAGATGVAAPASDEASR